MKTLLKRKYGFSYYIAEMLPIKTTLNNRIKLSDRLLEFAGMSYHSNKKWGSFIRDQRNKTINNTNLFDLLFEIEKQFNNTRDKGTITANSYKPTKFFNVILKKAKTQFLDDLYEAPNLPHTYSISIDNFNLISQRDEIQILSKVFSRKDDTLFVATNASSEGYRVFTNFTGLSKKTKQLTNYKNELDISAAVYAFMINFVDTYSLVTEPLVIIRGYLKHKDAVRKLIAQKTNTDLKQAKKILTAIGYGATWAEFLKPYKNVSEIVNFKKESDMLSKTVNNNLHLIADKKFQDYFKMKLATKRFEKPDRKTNIRAGYRLHIFLEYFEAKVRAELDPDGVGQPVHDAVYFKDEDIEEAKLRVTLIEKKYGVEIKW